MYPGRTTVELVEAAIETDDTLDVTQDIDMANELVTELCVPQGYSDYRLELIERMLAAHFYTVHDPRASQEQAGTVQQTLQGVVKTGLKSSIYGQNAMRLDTKGALAIMDNGLDKYAKIPAAMATGVGVATWLGTNCKPLCSDIEDCSNIGLGGGCCP